MCGLANMQILRLRPPTGRLLPGTRRPAVTSWDFSVLRNFVLSESSGPPSPGQFQLHRHAGLRESEHSGEQQELRACLEPIECAATDPNRPQAALVGLRFRVSGSLSHPASERVAHPSGRGAWNCRHSHAARSCRPVPPELPPRCRPDLLRTCCSSCLTSGALIALAPTATRSSRRLTSTGWPRDLRISRKRECRRLSASRLASASSRAAILIPTRTASTTRRTSSLSP